MQRHSVHRGGHAELADAVIDVAATVIVTVEGANPARQRVVRPRQIGAAADGVGQHRVERAKRNLARLAGGDFLRGGDQAGDVVIKAEGFGQIARHPPLKLALLRRCGEPPGPRAVRRPAGFARAVPIGEDIGRDHERLCRPAQRFARRSHFRCAQSRAVGGAGALLVGRALANDRAAGDERGARVSLRLGQRTLDIGEIVAVALGNMPARRGVTRLDVFAG